MKICKSCGNEYPQEQFTKNKMAKSGYGSKCLSCERQRGKAKRNKTPISAREAQLRNKYGITNQVYIDLAVGQDHRCKLCCVKTEETLHVDHCHESGIVRGLLCRACNTGLGFFKDNVETLKRAIIYVELGKSFKKSAT